MSDEAFRRIAVMEMANRDTYAFIDAQRNGTGFLGALKREMKRLYEAQKSFPKMWLKDMWDTDRRLSGENKRRRPPLTDLQKAINDPSWLALDDLDFLKELWKEERPGQQVPLDFLTEIVSDYRDVDYETLVSRRNKAKSRRPTNF